LLNFDFDIISAKAWQRQGDFIFIRKMIINRDLLKIKLTSDKVAIEDLQPLKERFALKTILVY
jgi:hypothetical protein